MLIYIFYDLIFIYYILLYIKYIKAYAALMTGYKLFEEQDWQAALEKFAIAR